MLTGSEAFLCLPGVSGLLLCTWTHLKKGLVRHSFGWWYVWQILRVKRHMRIQNGCEMYHCELVLFSILYAVFCIARELRAFQVSTKMTHLMEHYKSIDRISSKYYKTIMTVLKSEFFFTLSFIVICCIIKKTVSTRLKNEYLFWSI